MAEEKAEEKKEIPAEVKEKLKERYGEAWRKELRKSLPVKERMKIARQKMPEREPEERNKDFNEVNLGLEAEMARREAQRCLDCANPQCVLGCPVGIDIPTFVKLVEIGDYAQSIRIMKETNSLPSVCGRVCPQEIQCEEICNLKKATVSSQIMKGTEVRFSFQRLPRRQATKWRSSAQDRPA